MVFLVRQPVSFALQLAASDSAATATGPALVRDSRHAIDRSVFDPSGFSSKIEVHQETCRRLTHAPHDGPRQPPPSHAAQVGSGGDSR
jgi:hypothetical protein